MSAGIYTFPTLPDMFNGLVPRYRSKKWRPFISTVERWDPSYGPKIYDINYDRADRRIASYVDPKETDRVRAKLETKKESSIRFGVRKTGTGYHGERGDFCLIAGVIERRNLTLFYRSLELIGGLAYDICLINYLGDVLDIEWKKVTFHALKANVFALKRNSNEKLYPKLQEILR